MAIQPTSMLRSAVAIGLLAATTTPATAQPDIIDHEIDSGRYSGTIHVHGGFSFPLQDVGEAVFLSNINGTATLIAEDGSISGEWEYGGTGAGRGGGLGVEFTTESTYSGSGTFTGTPTAASVVGDNSLTSTGTFFGVSRTSTEVQPIDEPITDVLAGCGQVVASFDLRVNQEIESQLPGGDGFFEGSLVVYSDAPSEEAAELARRASEVLSSDAEPLLKASAALAVLEEVQELQAAMSRASDCPATIEFFNLLTNTAATLIAAGLGQFDKAFAEDPTQAAFMVELLLPDLVRLGLATGAMGGGAVGDRGDALMAGAKGHAQRAVDELLASDADPLVLVDLAGLSAQLGWDLRFGEASDVDVLVTLGVEP